MNILHGRDLLVKMDNDIIAGNTNCELNIMADVTEVSSATTGTWKNYKAMRRGWAVTTTQLLDSNGLFWLKQVVGKRVVLELRLREAGGLRLTGEAIVTQSNATAQVGSLVKGQFSFQGCGKLSDNSDKPIFFIAEGDYFTTVNNERK